ncbi:type I restriction-modification system subunit M [bacterium]|nr:type I restriction-modification system subunit M [bacterium]
MAIKKSELYSSLWKSCDKLRGGMDASQYKDYVLVLLFVKYVSDKYAGNKSAPIQVPKGGSFQDMLALNGKKDIGDGINQIISKLAEANDLKGVIDVADFADSDKLGKGKEMVDKLSELVAIFKTLDFANNRADGDDILGDAYEYLMRHFATESGKSKGQFYTPAEVSRILAKVIGIQDATTQNQTIYDPTCGSGSLLLKAADESSRGLTIYGQENDVATRGLARMNMILHNNPTADIQQGNTLAAPFWKDGHGLKTFDFAVANPPFSSKSWSDGVETANEKADVYGRFDGYGVPPAKNGDYAFLLHILRSLKSRGKAAIILPHGVLFRGGAEAKIRTNLIRRGYIKGIIALPANLFYGTGIPACIIVIDKENAESRKGIFMIDAGKGFVKDGNKNRLRDQDIHKIVDVFNKQIEVPKYSRLVSIKEIEEKNEFNLNIPRYIDSQDEEDIQDIEAHLKGGIPLRDIDALSNYWNVCPTLRSSLFTKGNRDGYCDLKVEKDEIKATIYTHPEFVEFGTKIKSTFAKWAIEQSALLKQLKAGCKPKEVIHQISEAILTAFSGIPLIDQYDVYQHLMTYWLNVMKDDLYIVAEDGWKAELTAVTNKKGQTVDYTCELIPKELVIAKYFSVEKTAIDNLEMARDEITGQFEEMQEEHGGDEGILAEAVGDNGKISKANVSKRIGEIKKRPEFKDERDALESCLALLNKEGELTKQIKEATTKLNDKVLSKYPRLTVDEIKHLVVDEKWIAQLQQAIQSELDRTSQRLTTRTSELAQRYDTTLSEITSEVTLLSQKVGTHLQNMGFAWE